jgi:hypothetical protein
MRKSRSSLLTTSGCSSCGKCLQLWIGATERLSAISLQIAFMSNKRPTASKSRPHSERTGQRISVRRLQDPARRDRNSANHVQGQRSAPLLLSFCTRVLPNLEIKVRKDLQILTKPQSLRHVDDCQLLFWPSELQIQSAVGVQVGVAGSWSPRAAARSMAPSSRLTMSAYDPNQTSQTDHVKSPYDPFYDPFAERLAYSQAED